MFSSLEWWIVRQYLGVLLFLLSCVARTVALASEPPACYYPDGAISFGRSCHPKAQNSVCCSPGFSCLSNGVCAIDPAIQRDFKYTYYRSSCTDKTWADPACPHFCIGSQDNRTAGHGLQTCNDHGLYCCRRDDVNCCEVPELMINLGKGDVVTSFPKLNGLDPPTLAPSLPQGAQIKHEPSNRYAKDTIIGLAVGFAVALLFFLGGCAFWCLRRGNRQRAKEREYEATHGNSELFHKTMSVSVSALGETQSSIELQNISSHAPAPSSSSRRGDHTPIAQSPDHDSRRSSSRPHSTRQRTASRSESLRGTISRDSIRGTISRESGNGNTNGLHRMEGRTQASYRPEVMRESLRQGSRDNASQQTFYRPQTPDAEHRTTWRPG